MYLLVVDRHLFQAKMSGHYCPINVFLLDLLVSQSIFITKFFIKTYARLRYFLEGDRPSQTVTFKMSGWSISSINLIGWYFMIDKNLT